MSAKSDNPSECGLKNLTRVCSRHRKSRGQAAVEFALVLTVAMIVLFVAVQMALLGQAALALGQMNYQGARYAAVHPTAHSAAIKAYMVSVGSPTITNNSNTNLSVTVTPSTTPRVQFTSVTVSVTYNAASQLVLPQGFMGINFPTTLQSSETAMSE